MKAVVDCNSFYCSCERVFRPDLHRKPVVVLSNNDGCIISRTDEAKALNVGMAVPYFMSKDVIEQNGISVFSSNYNLYGDMSRRVMKILKDTIGENNVEVYSVDEAFLNLDEFGDEDLDVFALELREKIEQWTGVEVSIGVASTKTLSKTANHIAKKDKQATNCICVLNTPERIADALRQTPVRDLWGVGRQYAEKLNFLGINTGWDLYNVSEEWARRHLGGVVGVRLVKELKGEKCITMDDELVNKKMIATTRMFGNPVTKLSDIKEAIATYTTRVAEKLRRQQSAASFINVFVVVKEEKNDPDKPGGTISKHVALPSPTSITQELIKPAVKITERLFKQGRRYSKAGVMVSGLVPDTSIQANLFVPPSKNSSRMLMNMMDNINFSMRGDVVKFAASGTSRNWKMRQEFHSPRYTTRWDDLYEVK